MSTANNKLDVRELRQQAHGRWLSIFQHLCPGMFDNAIRHIGTHVTCPFHGGENDFRLVKRAKPGKGNTAEVGVAMCTCGVYSDGFAVLERATGASFYEVLKMVDEYLNGRTVSPVVVPPPAPVVTISPEEEEKLNQAMLKKIRNMWNGAKEVDLTAIPYYQERGISPRVLEDVKDIRMVANLSHFQTVNDKTVRLGSFPAMLALMRDPHGDPAAVHRTWLSKDMLSKAPVPKPKKLTKSPNVRGAAVRLFDATGTDVLGLTEGIETALAARQMACGRYWPELGKIPVWACFAERNIRNFQIPEELKETLTKIVVFADNDVSNTGLEAAMAFKDRMASEMPHLIVDIKLPRVAGWDWLDALVNL